jgi:hypothetical protein
MDKYDHWLGKILTVSATPVICHPGTNLTTVDPGMVFLTIFR